MRAERCIHCAAMADEVAELRAALGLSGRLTDQRAIERRFKLTRQQARLAQALYDAAGRVVPRETLSNLILSETSAAEGSEHLKTVVCRVRLAIGKDAIDTAEGGYAMTAEGRALIYTALKLPEMAA